MSLFIANFLDFGELYTSVSGAAGSPVPGFKGVWFDSGTLIHGVATDNQPGVADPEDTFNGVLMSSTNSFLYGRVYIYPSLLQLGNLVASESRPIYVWNATFEDVVVTSLIGAGLAGVTLTEPFPVPFTLGPLQETQYAVAISVSGPPQVSATFTFVVNGITYIIQVSGVRVVLWPFPPNWSSTVNESLEYLTNVLESNDSSEQRICLRTKARRRLDYTFMVNKEQTQHFDNILFGWQNRSFAVPLWPYKCKTTADIFAGATLVPCNTINAGFAVGQQMTLFRNAELFDVAEISAIAPDGLTLSNPLLFNWARGASVMPVAVAYLESNVPVSRETGTVLTGVCNFLCSPTLTDPFIPDAAAPTIYNGYEVITYQHNWGSGVPHTLDFLSDVVDYETGPREHPISKLFPKNTKTFRWLLKNRQQIREFRELLGRLRGQQVACYIPSWHQDLTVTAPITAIGTTLTVRDRDFFALVGVNAARRHLMIHTRAGGIFYRPITSIGKTGNDLQINLTTALGVDLEIIDFKAVHFLQLYRLVSDRQTIQWHSDSKAIVEQLFQVSVA